MIKRSIVLVIFMAYTPSLLAQSKGYHPTAPSDHSMGVFMNQLLQDHDIQRFHALLSEEEATAFGNLMHDVLIMQKKLQDPKDIRGQEKTDAMIDQSLENDFVEFGFRYNNLLQKIYHDQSVAKKLMLYLANHLK